MTVHVRKNDEWVRIYNPDAVPSGINIIANPYTNDQRTNNGLYTNNTGRLLHVSAVLGFERDASPGATPNQVAGSYAVATIYSPSEDPNTDPGIEVARVRDNGNANTRWLFLNCQFIVPDQYSYRVITYFFDDDPWHLESGFETKVTNQAWVEMNFISF